MFYFDLLTIIYLASLGYLTHLSIVNPKTTKRLIFKIITSLLFIVEYIIARFINTSSTNFTEFTIALILAFLGDILLGFYNHSKTSKIIFFYLGTALFFAAQVFYILFYIGNNGFMFNSFYIGIPIIGVIGAILLLEKMEVKKNIMIAGGVYSLALSFMFATTFIYSIKNQMPLIFIAGLMFVISDFTLSVKYFSKKTGPLLIISTTVTYYIAQYLFILSIMI